jgi:acid phosphatase
MKYLDKKIGKWMPDGLKVAVDSRPRLSGTMDTVNATLAHGPETRMPKEFYDPKLLDIMTRIVTEEWYQGYNESQEYRMLGIGGLLGDVVARMAGHAEKNKSFSVLEVGGEGKNVGAGRGGEQEIKLGLSGCHDTTIAATLASLGCFDGEPWPFFTSHIAIELFRKKSLEPLAGHPQTKMGELTTSKGWWSSLFGGASAISASGIGRRPLEELSPTEKQRLEGFYVRIRYNDRIMTVPGCKPMGKHLEGDESFCTMVCTQVHLHFLD